VLGGWSKAGPPLRCRGERAFQPAHNARAPRLSAAPRPAPPLTTRAHETLRDRARPPTYRRRHAATGNTRLVGTGGTGAGGAGQGRARKAAPAAMVAETSTTAVPIGTPKRYPACPGGRRWRFSVCWEGAAFQRVFPKPKLPPPFRTNWTRLVLGCIRNGRVHARSFPGAQSGRTEAVSGTAGIASISATT